MTKENKLAHSFTITIPVNEFSSKIDAKLRTIAKEAKIQGFRPGQAPMTLIKSKYENAVKGEVLDALIQEQVEKTFKDKNIKPAVRPKVEIKSFEDGKDIELSVEVEALPEITPVDLKTISIERMNATVSDTEMEKALDRLLMGKRKTEIVDEKRATKTGDIIVIDFVGSINGEEFKGGKGKDYYLDLGSNTFIPGFEDQLTGKEIGSQVDVNVSFPEDYHAKDLAGKKALFKVDIKELRKVVKPELNDEFAKELGMKDVAHLKEVVKTELEKEYKNISRMHAKRALLDALAAAHSFEVPQSMVDMEFDAIWKQFEQAKKDGQLDEDEKSKSEEELKTEYRGIAERRVRLGLLLAEVANQNKITLSQEDVTAAVMQEARRYPGQEKMVFEYYQKNPQALDAIRAPLFEEKVVDYIFGVVNVNEKDVTPDELYAYNPDAK